ncbi:MULTISPECIES: type II toxin-antitoxin system YoeB family toxin [Glycomyces]|uniref:Endoribonuclease YoeB n=1 Tax=Glycomyces lechevalierae TaxID=256034 RepID=A0A9X3PGD7_9ACTN|nr:type II toxin-antitoxin system YoeB family toxin [Glycomyces lechevalierae]MDA1384835.1 type II toxin-antitoxin system YoeB family toxin [Glycomyces lechevalierae]
MRTAFRKPPGGTTSGWAETGRKIAKRVNRLIKEIKREPFAGIGKRGQGRSARGAGAMLEGIWLARQDSNLK